MKIKVMIVGLVCAAVVVAPAVAGQRSMKNTSAAANTCKAELKAKKVAKADWQGEFAKCLDNPAAYQ